MQKRKVILAILAAAAVSVSGIVAYYKIEGQLYVRTDDARVAANTVVVTPEIAGKVLEWRAKEGDMVAAGELMGRQDLESALTSGASSPQNLGAVAGVIAEKASIKAPISGQVIQSVAVVGQMAAPGTALAMVADTDSLYIAANIKEGDIARVRPGLDARVSVDAFGGRTFHGRIQSVGRATTSTFSLLAAQSGGGNYTKVIQVIPIKIALLDQGDARLMIGMNAEVTISLSKRATGEGR
jgi:multidrug resistance efflux pump